MRWKYFTIFCGLIVCALLQGCSSDKVSGKYYEFVPTYYPIIFFSQKELDLIFDNDSQARSRINMWLPDVVNDTVLVFERKESFIVLHQGIVNHDGQGGTYTYEGKTISIDYSNGEKEVYKKINNDSLRVEGDNGRNRLFIKGSDINDSLLCQRNNRVFYRNSNVQFEVRDSYGNVVLTKENIMSTTERTGYINESDYADTLPLQYIQIDFDYRATHSLEEYLGMELTVFYFGNPVYTFIVDDIYPFMSIQLGYNNTDYKVIDDMSMWLSTYV